MSDHGEKRVSLVKGVKIFDIVEQREIKAIYSAYTEKITEFNWLSIVELQAANGSWVAVPYKVDGFVSRQAAELNADKQVNLYTEEGNRVY